MKRKLIKHGDSSLTLALPKAWVDEFRLKKGQEVDVDFQKDDLVVKAKPAKEEEALTIDVSNQGKAVRKILGAAYKSGYDEVRIIYSTSEELKEIQNLLSEQFIGFQTISQSKDSLTIRNLLGNDFSDFPAVLRRFFHIISNLGDEVCEAAGKRDSDWLKQLSLSKRETDRLADFLRRALNRNYHPIEFKRNIPLYTIVEQSEKIANTYSELANYLSNHEIGKDSLKTLAEINQFLKRFSELLFGFDIRKMRQFIDQVGRLELAKKSMDKTLLLYYDRIISLVLGMNGPLMATYI